MRDYVIDFQGDLPSQMAPGNYKIMVEAIIKENDVEKKILDEEYYLKYE